MGKTTLLDSHDLAYQVVGGTLRYDLGPAAGAEPRGLDWCGSSNAYVIRNVPALNYPAWYRRLSRVFIVRTLGGVGIVFMVCLSLVAGYSWAFPKSAAIAFNAIARGVDYSPRKRDVASVVTPVRDATISQGAITAVEGTISVVIGITPTVALQASATAGTAFAAPPDAVTAKRGWREGLLATPPGLPAGTKAIEAAAGAPVSVQQGGAKTAAMDKNRLAQVPEALSILRPVVPGVVMGGRIDKSGVTTETPRDRVVRGEAGVVPSVQGLEGGFGRAVPRASSPAMEERKPRSNPDAAGGDSLMPSMQ